MWVKQDGCHWTATARSDQLHTTSKCQLCLTRLLQATVNSNRQTLDRANFVFLWPKAPHFAIFHLSPKIFTWSSFPLVLKLGQSYAGLRDWEEPKAYTHKEVGLTKYQSCFIFLSMLETVLYKNFLQHLQPYNELIHSSLTHLNYFLFIYCAHLVSKFITVL